MSWHKYDENCPGCKPVVANGKTGEPLPPDSIEMILMEEVWKNTTLTEREAYHDVMCNNSREPKIVAVVDAIVRRWLAKMDEHHNQNKTVH